MAHSALAAADGGGGSPGAFTVTSHALPVLPSEQRARDTQHLVREPWSMRTQLRKVLCSTRASAGVRSTLPGSRKLLEDAERVCVTGVGCSLQEQFLLTVCMAMAAAVLSAAFVVFLVRERATKAKHVQVLWGGGEGGLSETQPLSRLV
jgi:hypothetical protein